MSRRVKLLIAVLACALVSLLILGSARQRRESPRFLKGARQVPCSREYAYSDCYFIEKPYYIVQDAAEKQFPVTEIFRNGPVMTIGTKKPLPGAPAASYSINVRYNIWPSDRALNEWTSRMDVPAGGTIVMEEKRGGNPVVAFLRRWRLVP